MDKLAHRVYDVSENFPKSEIFGLCSQIRRASLSVVLNYIEGYARQKVNVMRNFYEISYGSLKETKYLLLFSSKRKYISSSEYNELNGLTENIGQMLWGVLRKL